MNTTKHPLIIVSRAVTCALASTVAVALYAQNPHAHDKTAASTPGNAPVTTATGNVTTTSAATNVKHADRSFVEKAAQSGHEEVELARLAAEKSTNPDVKKFAQMLVDDHTRANDELASLAAAKGIKLKDKDKNENRWAKKDAKDFDRDFVKKMLSDHKKDIDLFSKQSKNGSDADLVEFARKTLPKLEEHAKQVAALEKTIR